MRACVFWHRTNWNVSVCAVTCAYGERVRMNDKRMGIQNLSVFFPKKMSSGFCVYLRRSCIYVFICLIFSCFAFPMLTILHFFFSFLPSSVTLSIARSRSCISLYNLSAYSISHIVQLGQFFQFGSSPYLVQLCRTIEIRATTVIQ